MLKFQKNCDNFKWELLGVYMNRKNSYARLIFIITVLAICSIVILRYNKVASSDRKTLNISKNMVYFQVLKKKTLKK